MLSLESKCNNSFFSLRSGKTIQNTKDQNDMQFLDYDDCR